MIENRNTSHDIDTSLEGNREIANLLVKTSSLVDHYSLCYNLINKPDIDADELSWIFTYMRLFSIKDIKVEMRHNYQTKDISHIQSELSMALARVYSSTLSLQTMDRSFDRIFVRNILNFIPRGGGNGDELRLFILDMMRRHGIREGHRPGIDDPFLEEWHQKLHSNCTPEDITICEAYIMFQKTNSHDLFYKTLWERGGISIDFLRQMGRPLNHSPRYMPQLIPDLEHLLWILKQIHGGSQNFHYLLEVSKWQLDRELYSMLEEVKNNFGTWWIPGKIIDCRQRLKSYLHNICPRDPLMIDVGLDNIYKAAVEQIDMRILSGDDLMALIVLTLQNIQLSYGSEKITFCLDLWRRIKDAPDKWSHEWGLRAFAALAYLQATVQSYTDELYEIIQPKALILGKRYNINQAYLTNFAEEVIRSQNTFSLSKIIDTLFPILRKTAGIGSWKVVSHGKGRATGIIKVADSLLSFQGSQSETPHLMLVNKIDGIEDIPNWVSAILTTSDVDMLSHISIRCRNSKVMLATCYEQDVFEKIKSYAEKSLTVLIKNGNVDYEEKAIEQVGVVIHGRNGRDVVNGGDTKNQGTNSSKSGNLFKIKDKLPDFIKTPFSITVPFEAFERTLSHNSNSSLLFNKLNLEVSAYPPNYSSLLSQMREVIYNLTIPADIVYSIREKMLKQEGMMNREWSVSLEEAITFNIKRVWGSVWNERAYLSRFSRNISGSQIRMGVLIQNVIPADYSFIIHTRNPVSCKRNEALFEIVVGLGETLAGNSPGSPLGVISNKGDRTYTILSYPSKRIASFDSNQDGSYIIRSDSNDEDLSDFTGAGLYDSFFTSKPIYAPIPYDREKLFWDKDFQHLMFDSLIKIAEKIEDIMESPQDIEGVYSNDNFYVVQTRNQVLPD